MTWQRGSDGSDPVRSDPVGRLGGTQELRKVERSWRLAEGTLACPRCDVPVMPAGEPLMPRDAMACPFCGHGAHVRDFLSLGVPTRPTRVQVRVVSRARR